MVARAVFGSVWFVTSAPSSAQIEMALVGVPKLDGMGRYARGSFPDTVDASKAAYNAKVRPVRRETEGVRVSAAR